jgi:putative ABC transport system ATP-binding protein
VPESRDLIGRALADHAGFREALERAGLVEDLVAMGASIADTMVDIFRGLPPGHPLFDQFSFVNADELGEYEDIVKRFGVRGRGGATRDDRNRLLALPLAYIEPRHRLGLLDEESQAKLVAGRRLVREMLERSAPEDVAFYDPETVNTAAPVRDNLLFGRVNEGVADARERVRAAGAEIIDQLGLRSDIEKVGLDHQVGPAGRLLTATQRASVDLIRCIVKRPDIIVVDGGLASFNEELIDEVVGVLCEETQGRTLALVTANEQLAADRFEVILRFDGTHAVVEDLRGRADTDPRLSSAAAE